MRVVLHDSGVPASAASASAAPLQTNLPLFPVSRLVGHDGPVCLVRFTEDGNYCLTAGSDRTIRLWNPSRLDPAVSPSPQPVPATAHHQQLTESHQQISSSSFDHPIDRLPCALPIQKYEVRHTPTALAVHPAGTQLLTASNKTAVLIDTVSGTVLRQWHGHAAVINDVAFQPETITSSTGAGVLATASYDATVCLWDGRSNSTQPIQILKEAKDSVTSVQIVDKTIYTASVDGCLRLYDVRNGVVQCDNYQSPITSLAIPRDCEAYPFVAVSCIDGSIRFGTIGNEQYSHSTIINRENIPVLLTVNCQGQHTAGRYGLECSFNADASVLLSGSEDGRAVLYDCRSLQGGGSPRRKSSFGAVAVAELVGHQAPTISVVMHPQNASVAISASYDGNCVVWASRRDYMRWHS